tara:strand:+ start:436 stop:573 length:138 start_codon:yes stop_codon:yes gene_type:complete
MKKINSNKKINPYPYEDFVRLKELDPYETLIKEYLTSKQTREIIE